MDQEIRDKFDHFEWLIECLEDKIRDLKDRIEDLEKVSK